MKKTLDELLELKNEELYEYVSTIGDYHYTRAELLILNKQKRLNTIIKSTANNKEIIQSIKEKLRIRILMDLLEEDFERELQGWEIAYTLLNREPESRFNFIKRYRKYLTAAELTILLKYECFIEPPSYDEMLANLYLETLENKFHQ